ncbi:VOC family protein [Paenibacillus rhizovicinus]|uniref:VOC family protein n=1 Tax=Paenibacillus rhizovicinus TaxID=2704463 RepID=A0A6C0P1A0_9BACL|nr:VOC family protein [Paenibacillus rhizovicinus]QHW32255.1 VOC family protein [Paenibacillus rhizovicinus]
MTVHLFPFLMMDGNAKEAIAFYKEALDAELLFIQQFGDGPGAPEHLKDMVAHSVVKIGETSIMISDTLPGISRQIGTNVSVCINTDDIGITTKFYEKLKEEGQVLLPLQPVHYGPGSAIVTDKFGVTFLITTMGSEDAVRRGHQMKSSL